MEINLIIVCSIIMLIGGFLSGYSLGKEKERKNYRYNHYKRYYNNNKKRKEYDERT